MGKTSTGADDNSADNGVSTIRFGAAQAHEWGDGSTDTFVYFNDFEVYLSDQMP